MPYKYVPTGLLCKSTQKSEEMATVQLIITLQGNILR